MIRWTTSNLFILPMCESLNCRDAAMSVRSTARRYRLIGLFPQAHVVSYDGKDKGIQFLISTSTHYLYRLCLIGGVIIQYTQT